MHLALDFGISDSLMFMSVERWLAVRNPFFSKIYKKKITLGKNK